MTCPECGRPLHDYDVQNSILTCKAPGGGHRWTREDIPEGIMLTPATPVQVTVPRSWPAWLPGLLAGGGLGGTALLIELIARL